MIDVRWIQWNFWIDMHYEDVRINMHMYLINLFYDFLFSMAEIEANYLILLTKSAKQ